MNNLNKNIMNNMKNKYPKMMLVWNLNKENAKHMYVIGEVVYGNQKRYAVVDPWGGIDNYLYPYAEELDESYKNSGVI